MIDSNVYTHAKTLARFTFAATDIRIRVVLVMGVGLIACRYFTCKINVTTCMHTLGL